MYKNDKFQPMIEINLENGIYIFDNESATGKTRLCKVLKTYQIYGEPVASFTYHDILLGNQVEKILIPNKYKVILLDRYDLYGVGPTDLFDKCAENSIILIDCKGEFLASRNDDWCLIKMTDSKIEVTG